MPETRAAPRKPVKGPQRRAIGGSALIVVCDPVKHTYGTKSAGKFGRPKTTRTTRARARLRTHVQEASVIGAAVCFPARTCEIKSVKSSQVKFKFQWRPRPPPLGRPPAREIVRARRGATGMAAPSRGFIYPHFLFVFILIIAAPQYTNFVLNRWKTVRQC